MNNQFLISKSPRLRSTPFTKQIEEYGVKAYTVYNHMLLPTVFENVEADCAHLKEFVQIWDVSVERQIEISGPDSARLVQMMTCRDLSKAKQGICYYAPIIDEKGFLINDPLVMLIEEDKWWLSIADSDVLLYAKGLANGFQFEVNIHEAEAYPLAVQGPKSFALMEKVFDSSILDMKFFHFKKFEFENHYFIIARSGWSKQGGFEIYVDNPEKGQKLFDELMTQGKDFNVRPGCPNAIERLESGLLSYGNDITINDNILECGLDRFISLNDEIEYLAKDSLKKLSAQGIKKSLVGVKIKANSITVHEYFPIFFNGSQIGELRSATYSPKFKCCLGIAMIDKSHQSNTGLHPVVINNQDYQIELSSLSF